MVIKTPECATVHVTSCSTLYNKDILKRCIKCVNNIVFCGTYYHWDVLELYIFQVYDRFQVSINAKECYREPWFSHAFLAQAFLSFIFVTYVLYSI